jgi:hypothetical protein
VSTKSGKSIVNKALSAENILNKPLNYVLIDMMRSPWQEEVLGLLEAKFGKLDRDLDQLVQPLMALSTMERSHLILQSSRADLLQWLKAQ